MYLSYINENKYSITCKNITTTLETAGSSLLIKYLVTRLATTITQLSTTQSSKNHNNNRTTGYDSDADFTSEMTEDDRAATCHYTNKGTNFKINMFLTETNHAEI